MSDETLIEELAVFDTPTVADAVGLFGVRPRDEGTIAGEIACRFPELGVRVGYAATMSYRTDRPSDPPVEIDFQAYMAQVVSVPSPRFLVGEDQSERPSGVVTGEVNATLHKTLGCVGYITNGGIRDVDAFPRLGFQAHTAFVHLTTGYGHLTGFGQPVIIGNVVIQPGDLLHADVHGICLIPPEIATDLPEACRGVKEAEQEALDVSRGPAFTPEAYVVARQRYRDRLDELRRHFRETTRCRLAEAKEELVEKS